MLDSLTVAQLAQSLIVSVVVAIAASWFTARFALRRFYREKVWERKTAAYTAIFEALHIMYRWFNTHFNALITDKEIPEDELDRLRKEYRKAEADLGMRVDGESWLLPQKCRELLKKLEADMENNNPPDWFEFLDNGAYLVRTASEALVVEVRRDLGLPGERLIHRIHRKMKRARAPKAGTKK